MKFVLVSEQNTSILIQIKSYSQKLNLFLILTIKFSSKIIEQYLRLVT